MGCCNSFFLKTYNPMDIGVLYNINRGNQNQTGGLLIKGNAASVQVYGSQSKPTQLSDMVDLTDSEILAEGSHSFSAFSEYIYFTGTADSIEPVSVNFKEAEAKDQF